jgi:preprotein translocase subunit SecD
MRRRLVPAIAVVGMILVVAAGAVGGWRLWRDWRSPMDGGGLVLRYRVDVERRYDPALTAAAAVERTAAIMRSRLEKLDVRGNVVVRDGGLEVQLPGVQRHDDGARIGMIQRALGRSGRLEFKIVDDGSSFMRQLVARADRSRVDVRNDGWSEKDNPDKKHEDQFLSARDQATLRASLAELAPVVPKDHELLLAGSGHAGEDPYWRTYYVFARTELDNDYITDAELSWDQDTGTPEIALAFDSVGAEKLASSSGKNVGRKLAIVLEGRVESAPVLEGAITGGRARITMGGLGSHDQLIEDAKTLVAVLRIGGLPAPLLLESVDQVTPRR